MTCRHTLNLLEDYVDNELSTQTSLEIDKHLAVCDRCRKAYDDARSLKETLQKIKITPPNLEYQEEVVDLILARVTGQDEHDGVASEPVPVSPAEKRGFLRAIASFSVAASVLLSALMIEAELPDGQPAYSLRANDQISTSLFKKALVSGENSPFTEAEWNRLAGAMLMMGSPGPLGKTIILADLSKGIR